MARISELTPNSRLPCKPLQLFTLTLGIRKYSKEN
jgi:hypothetical protein